jgi:hypothetical protein
MITSETGWSHWAQSHSFQERGVLNLLGHNLKKVYGDPERDALPEHLRDLVGRLERAEREALHATER